MDEPVQRRGFWGRLVDVVQRYAIAEVVGTLAVLIATWWVAQSTESPLALVSTAFAAEAIGFYGVMAISVAREQNELVGQRPGRRFVVARRTCGLMIAEFEPAEVVDSIFIRPAMMVGAIVLLGDGLAGVMVGKLIADIGYYTLAAGAWSLTIVTGIRNPKSAAGDSSLGLPS